MYANEYEEYTAYAVREMLASLFLASRQENCKVRGLVHFSARNIQFAGGNETFSVQSSKPEAQAR